MQTMKITVLLTIILSIVLVAGCTIDYSSPITTVNTTNSATNQTTKTSTPTVIKTTKTTPVPEIPVPGQILTIDHNRMAIIDDYAQNTPSSAAMSVSTLAQYLVIPTQNDIEITRVIYTWIAYNISYNYNAFLTHNYGDSSASGVLQSRSSICEGYSSLFEGLAKAAGLSVTTIDGWAKGIDYSVGDQISGATNHAWNAVKINGGWYLIDSTWGAGSIQQNHFVQNFCEGYFLTPPETFIIDHFPQNNQWQLLKQPISQTEFVSLPLTYSGFFQYELSFKGTYQPVTDANGETSINLGAPDDVVMIARLYSGANQLSKTYTFVQKIDGQCQVKAVVPSIGNYILRVYAKNSSDTGNYWGAIDFNLQATRASVNSSGFPATYGIFSTKNVTLYSPMMGHMDAGTTVNFDLVVPGASDVAIVMGGDWQHLSQVNGRFTGHVNISAGVIQVCAKYDGRQNYDVLLEYSSP